MILPPLQAKSVCEKTIDIDVPCLGCGYNLRALQVSGACPECGATIEPSYQEILRRHAPPQDPLWEANTAWLGALFEGAVVILVAFALLLCVSFAPDKLFAWKTRGRVVMLSIVCVASALELFGVWKLCAPEPGKPTRGSRRTLRVVILLQLLGLFLVHPLSTQHPQGLNLTLAIAIPCIISCIFAPALLYVRVARLAMRANRRPLGYVARMLAVLTSILAFGILLPEFDAPEDSLYLIMRWPSIPFGSRETLIHSLRQILHGYYDVMSLALILIPLATAAALSRFAYVVLRFRRRSAQRGIRENPAKTK